MNNMSFNKLYLRQIDNDVYSLLEDFCKTCESYGYINNSSFKAMKLEWCKSVGEFWCAIEDNKISAVAGFHSFPEISSSAVRILFRGCELPRKDNFKGLGKAQWNSIGFREFIPLFINRCNSSELIITTNVDYDHSNGRSTRNHKVMKLMEKQGLLNNRGDALIYGKLQTIWQLNIDTYLERREKLTNTYSVIYEKK
jgi:hypothetical protein